MSSRSLGAVGATILLGVVGCAGGPRGRAETTEPVGTVRTETDGGISTLAAPTTQKARFASPTVAGYRYIGEPVVALEPSFAGPGGPPAFSVVIRLNRALPIVDGEPRGNLLVGDAGSDAGAARIGRRARHCYTTTIGNDFDAPDVRTTRVGSVVEATLELGGTRRLVVATRARPSNRGAQRRLGC
jgi:hypothetical protein